MNKCFSMHYIVSVMLLMINTLSFSMNSNLMRYVVGSALIGGGSYAIDRETSKYIETTLENVPCNVEKWARKNLVEKEIKNADTIPLKIADCWITPTGNSFIGFEENEVHALEDYFVKQEIDDEIRKKEMIAQEMLFHEAWHYQNNDLQKRYLVRGLTSGILFLPQVSVPRFLLKVAIVIGSNIAYIRHQETEADCFAFMNVPIENLEVCKARRLGWAELFEEHTLHEPFLNQKCYITKGLGFYISKRLKTLNQRALECDDNSDESFNIKNQKKILIGLADFCHDHEHPRYRRQVALVQECMDKRKELNRS